MELSSLPGTIDGKHVVLQCPANTLSSFFNYKGTFCIILLAVVGADYYLRMHTSVCKVEQVIFKDQDI